MTENYQPGALTATTYYRRKATLGGQEKYSNVVTITVEQPLLPGSIGGAQSIVTGGRPTELNNVTSATGANGSINYQWEQQTTDIWVLISGAIGVAYSPPELSITTRYRRKASSASGIQQKYSNEITVAVVPKLTPGSIGGTQSIITNGTPTMLTEADSARGGSGTINYQWEQKTATSWVPIFGATGTTYSPPRLTTTTGYRRKASNGSGTTLQAYYSNEVTVTVVPLLIAGSIGGTQTIISGNSPSALTSTVSASGGSGTINYQWEQKTATSWADISGATGTTYSPPALSTTTSYRRKASNGSGATLQTYYSNEITITVEQPLSPGSIGGTQTIVSGSTPSTLNSVTPATGSISYQWEQQTTGSWVLISGAIGVTYSPSALSTTTRYRRKANSASGLQQKYSNEVTVTVIPKLTAGTIGCSKTKIYEGLGESPGLIYSALEAGECASVSYTWEYFNGISWQAISGATGVSYQPAQILGSRYRRVAHGCTQSAASNEVSFQVVPVPSGAREPISYSSISPTSFTISPSGGWISTLIQVSSVYQCGQCGGFFCEGNPGEQDCPLCGYDMGSIYYSYGLECFAEWVTVESSLFGQHPFNIIDNQINISIPQNTGEVDRHYSLTLKYRGRTFAMLTLLHYGTPPLDPGSISEDQMILQGYRPALISGTSAKGGYCDRMAYEWQKSVNSTDWEVIPNSNAISYQPDVLQQSTYYRRVVRCGSSTATSNVVLVKVASPILGYSNHSYIASYTPAKAADNIAELAPQDRQPQVVYYDGLGRPLQQIAVFAGPTANDVITPITYDGLGRQDKDHLPYEEAGGGGILRPTALGSQQSWYGSLYPGEGSYAAHRREYDGSPLNRVAREYLPGSGAYATTATIDHTYAANAAGEVKRWRMDGTTLQQDGTYPPGTLSVHEVSDPDERITRSYTDLQGQTVETRQLSPDRTQTLTTSYVYNSRGLLAVVIPPKAQVLAVGSPEWNALVYRYTYDHRGRCIEKQLPDSEPLYYVYDKADRLILSQDGNQRARGEWSFVKYDQLGREILTGYLIDGRDAATIRAAYKDVVVAEIYNRGGNYGYTWNTPPLTSAVPPEQVLVVNHYDSYQALIDEVACIDEQAAQKLAYQPQAGYPQRYEDPTGLLTAQRVKRLDGNVELREAIYYDEYRRPIQTRSVSETDGLTVTHTAYTFTGQPAKSEVQHQLTANGAVTTEKYAYSYDHAGRLTELRHGVNAEPTTLATYSYDALGRQQQKALGSAETVASRYDIQGRLTALQGGRFWQELYYHTNPVGSQPQYGGNLSAVRWQQGTAAVQHYAYAYDGFSRLLSGTHSGGNGESQTYDPNGNLLSIARTGAQAESLGMAYSGNRITTANGLSYAYDANGNTITDGLRGMSIAYNRLNLPQQVGKGSDVLAYGYSADGQKREKKFNNTVAQHYRGSMVYAGDGTPEYVLVPEGMVRRMANGTWVRQYNLSDHLGNTRAVLEPNGSVLQQTDYYPFGTAFSIANTNKNRYFYGGKEYQDEVIGGTLLGLYDFEARFADVRIGRLGQPDPLREKYFSISPYAYCANNPILFVDPTGRELFIHGDEKYVNQVLNDLQKLSGLSLTLTEVDGKYRVDLADSKGSDKSYSASMVTGLISSEHGVTINNLDVDNNVNSYTADSWDNAQAAGAGSGGNVYYDSQNETSKVDADGNRRYTPTYSTLGHELVHARRATLGSTADLEESHETGHYFNPDEPAHTGSRISIEEVETRHAENRIRMEHGIPLRAIPRPATRKGRQHQMRTLINPFIGIR